MKIAKFKRVGRFSYDTIGGEELDGIEEMVRTSEYVEVDFPPLTNETVIGQQLTALDSLEQVTREKFQGELNGIKQQRAELQALPHRVVSEVA